MNLLVSSANNFGTPFLNAFRMSLMHIRKNRGPSTDPYGIPDSTIGDEDLVPYDNLHIFLGLSCYIY